MAERDVRGANLNASAAIGRAAVCDAEAKALESKIEKWTKDNGAKRKLGDIVEDLRALAISYRKFADYLRMRTEVKFKKGDEDGDQESDD